MECAEIMKKQGRDEDTGDAKITSSYNLPCRYVIHTVGPIIRDKVRDKDKEYLRKCYISCMDRARENYLESISFCCISTGEFHFPNDLAAEIAVRTVIDYREKYDYYPKVVFNVFKDVDYEIYSDILDRKKYL